MGALISGLAHKIRTHLSVISNELSYLSITAGDQPIMGVERCREISRLLKEVQPPPKLELVRSDLPDLLMRLGLPCPVSQDVHQDALRIEASESALRYALGLLAPLISGAPRTAILAAPAAPRLVLSYAAAVRAGGSLPRAAARSFTEYFCLQCGVDSFAPPLIDAVLEAHHACIAIEPHEETAIRIEFPLYE